MGDKLEAGFAKIFNILAATRENVENGGCEKIKERLDDLQESLLQLEEDVKTARLRGMLEGRPMLSSMVLNVSIMLSMLNTLLIQDPLY